jgi:signal transduction histidine kinase/DNA-binding response OmpR family regulator
LGTNKLGAQTTSALKPSLIIPRVLLVDDSDANLVALESVLEVLGETLVRARSGQEALAALLEHEFAVVLLDVRMPDMDGFEVARLIRQRSKELPIIFISAFEPARDELEGAYNLGAVDFVVKPLIAPVLRTKVRVFVDLFRSKQELARRVEERTEALVASERRLAAELESFRRLQQVSTRMISEENPQSLYEQILDAATAIMRSEYASIQMYYPERGPAGELRLLGFRGFNANAARFWEWVRPASESTCGIALMSRERVVVADVETCDFMAGSEDLRTYLETGIHAVQSTPLLSRGGQLLGMISTHWRRPHQPAEGELRLLDVLARQAADLIERSKTISEVRRLNDDLEKRVRERTASLEELIRELNTFAYTVAHDLRAPIRAMQTSADLLLEECSPQLGEFGRDLASRIARAGERMDALIRDLLAYSRLSREEVTLAPVDLNSILPAMLRDLEDDLSSSRGEVRAEGPLPAVLGNETMLRQALTNLVSNGLKFVAPEKEPRVIIRAESRGGHVRIWVEDNGIGISGEYHDRLFRVFERLHAADTYPGTGIGLAIVRRALERMSGTTGVISEEGKGSRFWIELGGPRAKDSEDAKP